MSSFSDSKDISELYWRIGNLESQMGAASPEIWKDDIAALRAETTHNDLDIVGVLVVAPDFNNSIYKYDASSSDYDNGLSIIKPTDIATNGRWILQVSFALAKHSHSENVEKNEAISPGNFITIDNDGKIADTSKNSQSFQASESGKGLSEENYSTEEKDKLEGLPDDINVDDKMDKVEITTTSEDKLLAIDETGNAKNSGRSLAGVFTDFEMDMEEDTYPLSHHLDTITIGTYRLAIVHYILGHTADHSQARAGTFMIFLDGENAVLKEGEAFITGTDFNGDITVSENSGLLRFSYTQEDGEENATYLGLQILLK